jgi:SAM-dependent methyltransferase
MICEFVCPRCHGSLIFQDSFYFCSTHREVGRERLGFPDFTSHPVPLPTAGGGKVDLLKDEQTCQELLRRAPSASFHTYRNIEQPIEKMKFSLSTFFVKRFHAQYAKIEFEAENRHGIAMLEKVDAQLAATGGRLPIDGIALEAAGGHGRFIEGFRNHFSGVVFVDCSLVNLVMARALAEEAGLDNIVFVRADVTSLPFKEGTFAFIHENNVIEHVYDPKRMINEAMRVLSQAGVYAVLSPNAFPITPEPHFGIPFFRVFPRKLRRRLIQLTRGITTEEGTDLRSLGELRAYFADLRIESSIIFLPPRLTSIARSTGLRRVIQKFLEVPLLQRIILGIANGPLLSIMPYHLVVVQKN